jgi:hypothetical protein
MYLYFNNLFPEPKPKLYYWLIETLPLRSRVSQWANFFQSPLFI